jgi:hypothetical protein
VCVGQVHAVCGRPRDQCAKTQPRQSHDCRPARAACVGVPHNRTHKEARLTLLPTACVLTGSMLPKRPQQTSFTVLHATKNLILPALLLHACLDRSPCHSRHSWPGVLLLMIHCCKKTVQTGQELRQNQDTADSQSKNQSYLVYHKKNKACAWTSTRATKQPPPPPPHPRNEHLTWQRGHKHAICTAKTQLGVTAIVLTGCCARAPHNLLS